VIKLAINVGFIWDIDGVVVDSPHEEAWRVTALKAPWNVDGLSTDFYFTHVASKPRYEGGNNILKLKGVYERMGAVTQQERDLLLEKYCSEKNALIRDLIGAGKFKVFGDAVALLLEAKSRGILQAAASASKNAKDMLLKVSKRQLAAETSNFSDALGEEDTLYSVFDVDACGTDFKEKKGILGYAAGRLNELAQNELTRFVVFEDAPAGIQAAKSLEYFAVGVLRIGEEEALRRAGADIVTRDLRTVKIAGLL